MPTIRRRDNGSFELRITHRALPKPYYSTHDSEGAARGYAAKVQALLGRGEVPPELAGAAPAPRRVPVARMLGEYLGAAPIAASDRPMVEWLRSNVAIDVGGVTVRWVDDWIRGMKRVERLAPGTIRKRIESLARALDWWNLRQHAADAVPANVLRMLPKGYSTYGDDDGDARTDARRDRRLAPGEAERIEATILGARRPDRQRPLDMPERDHFLLLWRLIVNTGLRLREAYRLRGRDLRFDLRTVHVARSKTGPARDVPMTREVHGWLKGERAAAALVFPFWDGERESLDRTTSRLSRAFARVFEYTGCEGLTEHDLRHEATCRWMLMRDKKGRWLFRPEEVRRITGHKNVQQFERYLSLRGSDLAERLW